MCCITFKKSTNHLKYLIDNKLPTEYKSQVQGGLYISEREYCDFISYHPLFKDDKKIGIVMKNILKNYLNY